MALSKDGLYWKVTDIEIDRQNKNSKVFLKGYSSKEDADLHKMQQKNEYVVLSDTSYPFVSGLSVSQIEQLYLQIKINSVYFSNAENV